MCSVRKWDLHVDTARPYQCFVQPIGKVGRHHQDSAFVRSYTIDGVEKTRERDALLVFVILLYGFESLGDLSAHLRSRVLFLGLLLLLGLLAFIQACCVNVF